MLKLVNCNNDNYKNKLKKYLENDVLNSTTRSNLVRKLIMEAKIIYKHSIL